MSFLLEKVIPTIINKIKTLIKKQSTTNTTSSNFKVTTSMKDCLKNNLLSKENLIYHYIALTSAIIPAIFTEETAASIANKYGFLKEYTIVKNILQFNDLKSYITDIKTMVLYSYKTVIDTISMISK